MDRHAGQHAAGLVQHPPDNCSGHLCESVRTR
jgi:hypothetical protein